MGRVRPPPIFLSFGSLSLGAGRLGPFWDILGQSESRRSWRTSRKKNQTRALGRREAPSAPKGPEGPLGPWGGPWGPPWALGWGVGGWGHAETRTSRKHDRAETRTCKARRKSSRVDGNIPQGKTIVFLRVLGHRGEKREPRSSPKGSPGTPRGTKLTQNDPKIGTKMEAKSTHRFRAA